MTYHRKLLNLCCASTVAALLGVLLFQASLTRAFHSVIEAAPPPIEAQIMDWKRCVLDVLGKREADTSRCSLYVPYPSSVRRSPQREAHSQRPENSGVWFMLAALSFPLSFCGAGFLGFLIFRE